MGVRLCMYVCMYLCVCVWLCVLVRVRMLVSVRVCLLLEDQIKFYLWEPSFSPPGGAKVESRVPRQDSEDHPSLLLHLHQKRLR